MNKPNKRNCILPSSCLHKERKETKHQIACRYAIWPSSESNYCNQQKNTNNPTQWRGILWAKVIFGFLFFLIYPCICINCSSLPIVLYIAVSKCVSRVRKNIVACVQSMYNKNKIIGCILNINQYSSWW